MLGEYTESSCPVYLTREGFKTLTANNSERLRSLRIHTDTIVKYAPSLCVMKIESSDARQSVLRRLPPNELGSAVLMDHLDWFDVNGTEAPEEVQLLWRVLRRGGLVLLRSASKRPWYIDTWATLMRSL